MRISLTTCFLIGLLQVSAQFDPAGGEPGSLAVSASSGGIVGYADSAWVDRGWQEIEDTTIGLVSHGEAIDATGLPDQQVVSLGDGGQVTVFFTEPIIDREGFDFAIFENGFKVGDGYYLELAFVEVSGDGIHWKRFPTISLSDTLNQVGGFETLDPEKLHGFAGKHQGGYGTPFDLTEIEVDSIHFIRCIDVVGKVDRMLGSTDSKGQIINDPYPTPGASGGFDLDAVVVLNMNLSVKKVQDLVRTNAVRVSKGYLLKNPSQVYNMAGQLVVDGEEISLETAGHYLVIENINGHVAKRIYWVY